MKNKRRWGIGAMIQPLAGLSLTLAFGLGCEGEVRPYKPNFGAAGGAAMMTPTASVGAAGAAPDQTVSAAPDDASESTNINQLQPAPQESAAGAANAASASAACADGSTESCGPEQQQGLCKFGTRTCSNGVWGSCVGAVLPAPRDCASPEDHDCDGLPDNRQDDVCRCAAGTEQACDEHPGLDGKGPCHEGQQLCVLGPDSASSDWGPCTGAVGPSQADSCSVPGDDSTCDGTPNGGCTCVEGETIACGPQTDDGICQRGTSRCQNGTFTPCQGAVFPTRRDCSSPQDNDCNGAADNTIDSTCQCIPGQGNGPCSADPTKSRCTAQGTCAPCQSDADCSLVSGGRNLCRAGVCTAARCGDGVVQPERGETCDDGNVVNGDGCSEDCVAGRAPRGSTSFVSNHLCAVLPSGAVSCWGRDNAGQLGRGSMQTTLSLPAPVARITTAIDVAVMGDASCAALRDGSVSCWGSGFGSLPTTLQGVTGVTQLSAGDGNIFCGRQSTGLVTCWASDAAAQQLAGLDRIVMVARGDRHACALRTDGNLLCFGGNSEGECGRGIIDGEGSQIPQLATVFRNVAEVATGYHSTCVRTQGSGNVQCVGRARTAGSPTALPDGNPQPVTALNLGNAVKVVAGEQHICALTSDNAIKCWGIGLAVGNGSDEGSSSPVAVSLPGPAIDVGAGSLTSCALLRDSSVYCWGALAPTSASAAPVLVSLR